MKDISKITIEFIPHSEQRYETVGDWFYRPDGENEELVIRVSRLDDWHHEALVAVHELVEVLQCRHTGVTQQEVDEFDMEFERNRAPGNLDEPGDDEKAPYSNEHCVATAVERLLCAQFGCGWKDYENRLNALFDE